MDTRQRRTGVAGWWARYAGSVAFVSLLILGVAGFARVEGLHVGPLDIDGTIEQVEAERQARAQSVSDVISLFCRSNNDQDHTLARLVAVSIGGGAFGEGIDPATLTAFDVRVLTTIATVQEMTADQRLERVFRRELADLRDPIICQQLVNRYFEGKPIPLP